MDAKKNPGVKVSGAAGNAAEKIEKLMELMNAYQFAALELESADFKVKLEKHPANSAVVAPTVAPAISPASAPAATPVADANLLPIKSPIVGTFYASPSPESAAFVAVGDKVNADTIVCIIEAMKIMNEIKAEISGVIEKALVANGDPIEYGQPLFLVRK